MTHTAPTRVLRGKRFDKKSRILIIYTGGTIGMRENPVTLSLEPFDFNHLIENVPKLRLLDIDFECYEFKKPIDSSCMTPEHWRNIARVIERCYDGYDGFVVLHGTDTMAYTASALSFMLRNLQKPVIITGSQLPIGDVRTDGEENLITALQVASDRDRDGRQMVREVAILFEDFLWRGNRATKHSADNFNAFSSNNYPPLASIGLGIHYNGEALMRSKTTEPLEVDYAFDDNVMFIDLFPGISERVVSHLFHTPGIKGIVLKTFGSGNGPSAEWFINELKSAVDRGIVVINITQCSNGCVNPTLYSAGLGIYGAGAISGHDLTSEAAITKLMHLFGSGKTPEEVKRLMVTPLAGEMTVETAETIENAEAEAQGARQ